MSNYNIHIDKPLPPPPQIDSHQDFDQLYGKYRGVKRFEFWRNLYRKPTYFAALVGLMAIGYLVVNSAMKGEAAAFVQPPFEQIQLPWLPVAWDAADSVTYNISADVTITVPASAFVDAAGKPISGPVVLRYRELNDPKDWFLAGIPMGYDSAEMHHLEVATMIEVLAYQEGKPVFLKEGKTIELTYLAANANNRNQYFLDSLEQNWVHTGIDELIELEAAATTPIPPKPKRPTLLTVRDREADTLLTPKAFELPPQKPGKPFKVNIKNLSDFPEMKGYEDVYWEKIKDSHANDPNREQIRWGSATLRRTRGVYELTFSRQEAGTIVKRVVYGKPMFRASSAQDAQRIYREQYTAYQAAESAYQDRKAATAASSAMDVAAESERLAAEQTYLVELAAWKAQYGEADPAISRFMRRLLLNRLGIHASGQASPLLQGSEVQIILPIAEDKGATSLSGSTLYFTLQTGGSLLEVSANEAGSFALPYPVAAIEHAWLMTEAGKLAIVKVSDTDEADSLPARWVETPESLAGFRALWK